MSDLRRKLAQRVALGTEIAGNPATPSAEAPISERLRLEPEVKDRRLESPAYRARVERLQGMLSSMIARQQADVRTTPRSAVPVELSRRGALKFGPLPGTETLTPYGRLHLVLAGSFFTVGQRGACVAHALKVLTEELAVAMAITGCANISDIDRGVIFRRPDWRR